MGSTGLVNKPASNTDKYTNFNNQQGASKWFANDSLSNYNEWENGLSTDEKVAIQSYTGSGYDSMNKNLYTTQWDDLDSYSKNKLSNLYNALSKFELKHGINVTRQSDFQIFGAKKNTKMSVDDVKKFLTKTNGVLQNDGFLSASADDQGRSIEGSGLVLHFQIPPSVGAGAYVAHLSSLGVYENEYLINNNAVFKFDPNSVYSDGVKIHVTGAWLGQAKKQSFDKSKGKKKK